MRAADLQTDRLQFPELDPADVTLDPRATLKLQVAERLAAHRSRRTQDGSAKLVPIAEPKATRARSNRIASTVAERYAQTQSYRDFLAAEAARAIEAATAAAEVAARNAEAVTVAQQQLLADLETWAEPGPEGVPDLPLAGLPIGQTVPGVTVRLYEGASVEHQPVDTRTRPPRAALASTAADEEENFLLDEEIAFRQTPVFPEPPGPTVPIAANLIEFPRQLIAPRKARPRLAEGPLREEADAVQAAAQLRIFEVEPDQISTSPSAGVEVVTPEWSSIRLDAAPTVSEDTQEELQSLLPLQTASLNLRLMAAAVDACILGATFLGAASAFAYYTTELPGLAVSAIASAATLLILLILYHLLFFTFSDATPGMRYARIGLCTFSDENPTRAQMRRRTWAMLLSACPLGIGFLWALLDDDRLGWHDRISLMYQRSY